jgi:hypothetical protein
MKKSIAITALLAFLLTINVNAQEEPKQQKKEKAKKECNVNGKKCCSGPEKKGCASEPKRERSGHCDPKKTE